MSSSLDRAPLAIKVNASLESVTGIGVKPVLSCPPRNRFWRKERGLKKHIGGGWFHRRGKPTHNARHPNRPIGICNQERRLIQFNFGFVEQCEFFALFRQPNINPVCERAKVVRMHRLIEFQHDVVGDVDHRVDRSKARSPQFFLEPKRALGIDLDAFDHATHKSRAFGRRRQRHREGILNRRWHVWHLREGQIKVIQEPSFPCKPDHTQTIAAIRREIHLDRMIIKG